MDLSKTNVPTFDPRDPRFRRKLWVSLVTPGGTVHHVYWRRVAALAGLAAMALWLGLAGAAWGFVKYRRGFADVSYLDLAFFPLRHAHYRAQLGRHYLAQGRAALSRQEFQTGYALMNAGLARVPGDLAARREVALIDLRLGRPDRALRTLGDGLPAARDDLEHLRLLFGLLTEMNENARIITLATELLPATPDAKPPHLFLSLQAAYAHYRQGHAEDAERLVQQWTLDRSPEGQILLARCDWDRGLPELALLRLEQQLPRFSRRDELYLELVRLHREAGHAEEARRYALLRQFDDPHRPGPRIDLLHAYHATGDTGAGQRELAAYLSAFGRDRRALELLAAFAVDTRQPALAAQVAELAGVLRAPPQFFDLARVQAAIAARDYRAALDFAEQVLQRNPSAPHPVAHLFRAQQAVALFGLGEQARAQALLTSLLDSRSLRASDALGLARQLTALAQQNPARLVLTRAVQLDPRNQVALTELVRLDAEAGDRAAVAQNLPALLALRKPSRPALEAILRHLNEADDEPLREQLRAALARPTAPPDP